MVTVCPSQFATRRTLFHVVVGCGMLMLKVSRLKLPVLWLLVSIRFHTLKSRPIWRLPDRREQPPLPRWLPEGCNPPALRRCEFGVRRARCPIRFAGGPLPPVVLRARPLDSLLLRLPSLWCPAVGNTLA